MHSRKGVIKDGVMKNRYSSLTRNNFDLTYIVLAALQNDYAINLQNGTSVENCLCLSTVPALYIYAGLHNVPFLASKKRSVESLETFSPQQHSEESELDSLLI